MDNSELLNQIAAMFEKAEQRTNERFDSLDSRMDSLDSRMDKIENRLTKLEIKIEHDISHRIEALFDGYKLAHEKQWELDREIETIKQRLEKLEIKAG